MSEKISSASDSDFRAEITKNIPGKAATNAVWALTIANYMTGKHLANRNNKRRKVN